MADDVEVKLGANADGLTAGMNKASANVAASAARMQQQMTNMAAVAAAASAKWAQSQYNIAQSTQNAAQAVQKSSQQSSQAVQQSAQAVTQHAGTVQRTSQSIVQSTEAAAAGMNKLFAASVKAAGALIGAWLGHKAIESVYELEDGVEKLQRTMGLGSEEATTMAIALKLAGTDADKFTQTALGIGRAIKTDSAEFARLGVTIKDASGNLLPMDQIMRNVYSRMLEFKAGTDQDMFALATAGRSAKDFGNEMENLARVQGRAAEIAKAYGVEMGESSQNKIKAFKTELAALGEVLTIAATKVAIELMPAVRDLGEWLVSSGPRYVAAFIDYIELLRVKFEVMSAEVKAFTANASAWFENMVTRAQKAALTISMTIDGQIKDVPAMWKAANDRIAINNKKTADDVVNIWSKAIANIDAIRTKGSQSGRDASDRSAGTRSGKEAFTVKPKATHESGDISGLENELKAERDDYNKRMLLQGSFEEWSITQTRDYWETALALTTLSAKQRRAVEDKYYDAERSVQKDAFTAHIVSLDKERESIKFDYDQRIQLAQQAAAAIAQRFGAGSKEAIAADARVTQEFERQAEQRMRIADVARRQEEATAQHGANMEQLAIDQRVAMQEISREQAIVLEQGLQDRLYAIKLAAYQKELLLERDPVKIAALNAQIEGLEQQHQEKMTQLQKAAELERAAASIAAQQSIRDGLSSALQMGLQDWKNWKQAGIAALKTITDAITKMVADQWIKKLLGPGTEGGGFLKKITDWFGGNTGKAAGGDVTADTGAVALQASATALDSSAATLDTSAVSMDTAAVSMSAAGASLDAAAAALSAAAATMSAGGAGGLGSLFGGGGGGGIGGGDGGFGFDTALAGYAVGTPYVPQDTLAVVHKGEAIIPAKYNGGGNGGGTTNHGGVNMSFNIQGPVDTRTQGQIYASAYRGLMAARARNT